MRILMNTRNSKMVKIDVAESFAKELKQVLLENKSNISYMVMNKGTRRALEEVLMEDYDMECGRDWTTYWGVPFAVCNVLKFGEVELI